MSVVVDQFEVLPAGGDDGPPPPAPAAPPVADVADQVRRTLEVLHERAVRLRAD